MESLYPLIVDVVRGSLEDGPGIRSVVFFKGCPLNCIFCHNPETQEPQAEMAFNSERCIQCGSCAEACPESAIDFNLPGRISREKCVRCGDCAVVCPGGALRRIGRYYPVSELKEILMKDNTFYRHSGGGVTLSGGECTMYPYYLESLLFLLKAEGIHVTLETGGYFEYTVFKRKILPYIDLIYYDIKFADREMHIKYTGKSNRRILDNFRRVISEADIEIHPRLPLVPGITATRENFSAVVDFLCQVGADSVSLLPYNPLGLEMAASIGKPVPDLQKSFMKPDEERKSYALFENILEKKRDDWR